MENMSRRLRMWISNILDEKLSKQEVARYEHLVAHRHLRDHNTLSLHQYYVASPTPHDKFGITI